MKLDGWAAQEPPDICNQWWTATARIESDSLFDFTLVTVCLCH